MVRGGNVKVERLKAIGMVPSGNVAAHDERKLMRAQIVLETSHIHICRGKGSEFRRRNLLLQSGWARTRYDLRRIKFPKQISLSDKNVRSPINSPVGESGSQRRAGCIETVGEPEELQSEIIATCRE